MMPDRPGQGFGIHAAIKPLQPFKDHRHYHLAVDAVAIRLKTDGFAAARRQAEKIAEEFADMVLEQAVTR